MKTMPVVEIILNPLTPEAKANIGFNFDNKNIGNRSKFGGFPEWIQGDETPECSCGKKMTFYGQLDSLGGEFILGDCGMLYNFFCFDCCISDVIFQCY